MGFFFCATCKTRTTSIGLYGVFQALKPRQRAQFIILVFLCVACFEIVTTSVALIIVVCSCVANFETTTIRIALIVVVFLLCYLQYHDNKLCSSSWFYLCVASSKTRMMSILFFFLLHTLKPTMLIIMVFFICATWITRMTSYVHHLDLFFWCCKF